MEKIKDTNLGVWLKQKAPDIFDLVKDILPDSGGLGIVKNLLDKKSEVNPVEAKAIIDAEVEFQRSVDSRWKADMSSDSKLSKAVRPLTLIALLLTYLVITIVDSFEEIPFEVKDGYIDLLQVLCLTAFGAYFAGRSIEKTRK